MVKTAKVPEIVEQKLQAFTQIQPEFEYCFHYVEEIHGQKRFATFTLADVVRYLHSLWMCECKTSLLSVARTVKNYDGRMALALLLRWQVEDDTAGVVTFLQRKLDMLPLAEATRRIQEARQSADKDLEQRWFHGREVLLRRGCNLMGLLEALFAPQLDELHEALYLACKQYGHLPAQIEQQLAAMDSPLYSFVPHYLLAQRNMRVMNMLGVNVAQKPEDMVGQRSWRIVAPTSPLTHPFAEQLVTPYIELNGPEWNNVMREPFVDRPEQSDMGTM
ncbi:MAG TPA: hypothetical protein VL461_09935 [Dictyobacter sp.]|jgi:hypothetical protein|nr:hypothetical protein [Dictyobacter sp.]